MSALYTNTNCWLQRFYEGGQAQGAASWALHRQHTCPAAEYMLHAAVLFFQARPFPATCVDRAVVPGAILTKMDGDSRGGAALSVFAVSGRPIKFVGTGEAMEALEPFYPERIAQRVLGASPAVFYVGSCPFLALAILPARKPGVQLCRTLVHRQLHV